MTLALPPLVAPGPPLTTAERVRYSRNLLLAEVGELGQRRLRNASITVLGAGGLGAPVLLYLAAVGVGRLTIVDSDHVEPTNLQRQVLYRPGDVGKPKAERAAAAVRELNPDVAAVGVTARFTEASLGLLADCDLVIDGTDNFATRYLVNDACVAAGVPEVWAAVSGFDAQVSVFWGRPPQGVPPVQLRDLFPAPPPEGSVPSCAEGGVLGSMCGQVGSIMATEAIKLITGVGAPLLGRVLVLDAGRARWTELDLRPGPARPASDGVVREPAPVPEVSATELAGRLAGGEAITLVDIREPWEMALVAIPGARHVPFSEILAGHWEPAGTTVLYCRSGHRSRHAAAALRSAGRPVSHLAGGVLAWVDQIDPSLPRY